MFTKSEDFSDEEDTPLNIRSDEAVEGALSRAQEAELAMVESQKMEFDAIARRKAVEAQKAQREQRNSSSSSSSSSSSPSSSKPSGNAAVQKFNVWLAKEAPLLSKADRTEHLESHKHQYPPGFMPEARRLINAFDDMAI